MIWKGYLKEAYIKTIEKLHKNAIHLILKDIC